MNGHADDDLRRQRPSRQSASAATRVNTHRWPRATTTDLRWGPLCDCGNLKTDQALTCTDCAIKRRRAPDYWDRLTCACGGPKSKMAARCRPCANELLRGQPVASGRPQPQEHPWRVQEAIRLAKVAARLAA